MFTFILVGLSFLYDFITVLTRTYTHTYIRTYLHTYIPTYIHTYVRTYVRTYVSTYIHAYKYALIIHGGTLSRIAIAIVQKNSALPNSNKNALFYMTPAQNLVPVQFIPL